MENLARNDNPVSRVKMLLPSKADVEQRFGEVFLMFAEDTL